MEQKMVAGMLPILALTAGSFLAPAHSSEKIAPPEPAPGRRVTASHKSVTASVARPGSPLAIGHGRKRHFPAAGRIKMAQLFVGEVSHLSTPDPAQENSSMPTLENYWKTLDQIRSGFYNPSGTGKPDETLLTYAAIRGVLGSLNDPYTRFLAPRQYADMQNENRGTFPGIGVELSSRDGKVFVDVIVPDSPAAAAPLKVGDQVVQVGAVNVVGKTSDAVGELLKGEEGTRVMVTVARGGQLLPFPLTRREVSYPHFESHIMDGDIGYMHLMMFDEQASDNIDKALRSFTRKGVKGILFDLRDNPGGLLNAAVDVASKFIPNGSVVWVQERGGQRNPLPTTEDPYGKHRLPLVVLVNHYSASASEILSGAIKDTHSGTLVGLTTWGKGLVQEIIPLNDNSALALTTAHYFTPNGTDINLKGVSPDIEAGHIVQEPDEETTATGTAYKQEKRTVEAEQLQRAMQVLRAKIAEASHVAMKH